MQVNTEAKTDDGLGTHDTVLGLGSGSGVWDRVQVFGIGFRCLGSGSSVKRKIWAHLDLLSIPQSGGEMSKRLGGTIGYNDKTSS